ncbi:MAG: GNAT family N-acetyltransferase [Clostridia bacterium]|nr:GNAT family N-acetyltransferase [Clostridia bacterium]
MISLRNYTYSDINFLQEHGYGHYSPDELKKLIDTWNSKIYDNSYFEMFAIDNGIEIVGYGSLYQRAKTMISCGLEIYSEYQRKGYATIAYRQLLDIAEQKGYAVAVAQVLVDNVASIALHKKLGFEAENYEYINKKGDKVYYFIKSLSCFRG